jgi:hypothetical protein
MLNDIVTDAALQSHHEVSRSRAICHVCNIQYALLFLVIISSRLHYLRLGAAWVCFVDRVLRNRA